MNLTAKDVYILMEKEYRISRNIRAEWYLKRINSYISINRQRNIHEYTGELEVISVVPDNPPQEWDYDTAHEYQYLITEKTRLFFLSRKYNFVFVLDFSPSLASGCYDGDQLYFNSIFKSLEQCLKGIVKPFNIPGSELLFHPKIYVTVIGHVPFFKHAQQQVLVQGYLLVSQKAALKYFLKELKQKISLLQAKAAKLTIQTPHRNLSERKTEFSNEGREDSSLSFPKPLVSPDIGFMSIVQQGILALHLLPENSMSGIIILTDGVLSLPDATIFDTLLAQLRNLTISCSFVQLTGQVSCNLGLGYVPFNNLMSFLANATFGTYFNELPSISDNYENEMNDYHKAFLTWGLHNAYNICSEEPRFSNDWSPDECTTLDFENFGLIRRKERSCPVRTNLTTLLSCRLREGFTIRDAVVSKTEMLVVLILHWKYNISIEYHVKTKLPLSRIGVEAEVWVQAAFEFLGDLNAGDTGSLGRSSYRQKMVRKYRNTLHELEQSDMLLSGLQEFSMSPSNYTLSDCLINGQPAFLINSETNTPEPVGQLPSLQFEYYWKPVCMLNVSKWQKWMHTHRISLLLQFDTPLSKNLHVINRSGRYGIIHCRQAQVILNTYLREWTDFILVENHSYIKFIYDPEDGGGPPISFLVVRITSNRPPCMTLRLAFLGGTSGEIRHKHVKQFREGLLVLKLPQKDRTVESSVNTTPEVITEPLDDRCCTILTKPIDKILIWYDRMPQNLMSSQIYDLSLPSSRSIYGRFSNVDKSAINNHLILSRYLHHRRWLWGIQKSSSPKMSKTIINKILSVLTKIRLLDGFQFTYSYNGITNLSKEFKVKLEISDRIPDLQKHFNVSDLTSNCVVQFVIFPPVFTTSKVSFNEDSDGSDNGEVEGETQLVTECWIEPQNGELLDTKYNYRQLGEYIFRRDEECVWSLVAFECMIQIGSNRHYSRILHLDELTSKLHPLSTETAPIQKHLFAPDFVSVFNKARQTEILLSTLIQDCSSIILNKHDHTKKDEANFTYYEIFLDHLDRIHEGRSIILSSKECSKLPFSLQKRQRSNPNGLKSPILDFSEGNSKAPQWRCFIHLVSQTQVIVTVVPASYSDLKSLFLTAKNLRSEDSHSVYLVSDMSDIEELELLEKENQELAKQKLRRHQIPEAFPIHSGSVSSRLGSSDIPERTSSLVHRQPVSSSGQSFSGETSRVRYKSGPAQSDQGTDNLQPCRRERSSSLFSNRENGKPPKPNKPEPQEEPKRIVQDTWAGPNLNRKRNVSMPAKTHHEMTSSNFKCVSMEAMKEDLYSSRTGKIHSDNTAGSSFSIDSDSFHHQMVILGTSFLPVYVYDCRLPQVISQLTTRIDRVQLVGNDLNVDSTFDAAEHKLIMEMHRPSSVSRRRKKATSRSSDQERYSQSSETQSEFVQTQINAVEICQRQAFVEGVYKALYKGLYVNGCDVLSAMDQCEEIVVEIDITNYMKVVCGHLKHFIYNECTPSTEYQSDLENQDTNEDEKSASNFPLKNLSEQLLCHDVQDIHDEIRDKFQYILLTNFKSVPDLQDYYYYAPDITTNMHSRRKKKSGESSIAGDDDDVTFINNEEDGEITSVPFYSHRKLAAQISTASQYSTVTFDRDDTASSKSYDESTKDFLSCRPLFLHMTCSIKLANQLIATTPVANIPTCLAEISNSLDRDDLDVDQLTVFLDVLCLNLQEEESPSDTSRGENRNSLSTRDDDPDSFSYALSETGMQKSLIERELSELPVNQRESVNNLYDQVNCLLQNEIVASKLQNFSIKKPVLLDVIDYVLANDNAPNHLVDHIPLNFVYGVEESLEKFNEELKKRNLCGYRFVHEEDLFYVALSPDLHRKKNLNSHIPPSRSEITGSKDTESSCDGDVSGDETPKKLLQKVSFEKDGMDSSSGEGLEPAVIAWEETEECSNLDPKETVEEAGHSDEPQPPNKVCGETSSVSCTKEEKTEDSSTPMESVNLDQKGVLTASTSEHAELTNSHPMMPPFWLIIKVSADFAVIYFHHRNVDGFEEFRPIFNEAGRCVKRALKLANQKLLLNDLADSRSCSHLLEPESSDDIWKREDDLDDEQENDFLEAEMKFRLGAFSCPKVWSTSFELHHRIKTGNSRSPVVGLQVLLTCLKPFEASNRTNMFVYTDTSGVGTNVFYLRLDENPSNQKQAQQPDSRKEDACTSRSSIISLGKRSSKDDDTQSPPNQELRPRVSSFGEKDVIVEGLPSRTDQKKRKDYIVLSVHGVETPGPAIKEGLVQMLQKKLDDAALDAIFLMLFMNPLHKLSPEDVHFIQPPSQLPNDVFKFSLNNFAVRHLQAYSSYLKQNMYSCGFTKPKYADSKPCYQFQNFSATDQEPGGEPCIFLYVCPKKEGTKGAGIACIAFSIVDSIGNSIQDLGAWDAHEKPEQLLSHNFEEITQTFQWGDEEWHEQRNEAMLQFSIWESGRLDMAELLKNIKDSIRHALWDLAMEYSYLSSHVTAPEEVPTLAPKIEIDETPVHKTSVDYGTQGTPISNPISGSTLNEQQITGRPSPKSPYKPGRHSFDFGKQVSAASDSLEKTEIEGYSPTHKDVVPEESQELNEIYSNFIVDWLEFGFQLGCPSVRKHAVKCPTRNSVYTFVSELQTCLNSHLKDRARIFQLDVTSSEKRFIELVSLSNFSPSSDSGEVLDDLIMISFRPDHEMPLSSQQNIHELSSSLTKGKKHKRFDPIIINYTSNLENSSESSGSNVYPSPKSRWNATQPYFIRRQICFVAVLSENNLTMYMYNWVKELNEMLTSFFANLMQWTTARFRLLSSLVLQKMGIFHNQPFVRKEAVGKDERNVYVQSMNHVEHLIKCTAQNKEEAVARAKAPPMVAPLHILTGLYKKSIPPKLNFSKGDLLFHHGKQMIEIYRTLFQRERENWVLETIMKTESTSQVFTLQRLAIFKKHSRQSHFCLTPLLFLPKWRRQIAAICDHFAVDTPAPKNISPLSLSRSESRSRHSSGNTKTSHMELRRSASIGVSSTANAPIAQGGPHLVMGDDKWYDALCLNYLKEYIQYLESLGFSLITVRQEPERKTGISQKDFQSRGKIQDTKVLDSPSHLLKNLHGGIILIRINFMEPFFSTTIFALESARLARDSPSSVQCIVPESFLDQVDRHKILLHMHSFTYDYHLRSVCDSIANRQLLFTSGFNFASLLSDFMKYYRKSPNFARNLIHQGELYVEDIGTIGVNLYNYVLARERQYDMKVLRMNPIITDATDDLSAEYALVHTRPCNFSLFDDDAPEDEVGNYEVALLICHHPLAAHEKSSLYLHLKYFVILTSKREVYPSRNHGPLGRFRTVSTADHRRNSSMSDTIEQTTTQKTSFSGTSSESTHSEDFPPEVRKERRIRVSSSRDLPEIRQESVNYLGFFSDYEMAMQEILRKQSTEAENRIKIMFNKAKVHCRRDSLWQKLVNLFIEEEVKTKGLRDQSNNLTFVEATELISLVDVQMLTDFDNRFTFLESKSIQWYQGLMKVLLNKYQERSRLLQSSDYSVQYLIVNNDSGLNICMMISVNMRSEKAEIRCLRKDLPTVIPSRQMEPAMRVFLEDFVNCICFHLWTGLL